MPRIQLVTTGGTIASTAATADAGADVVASVRGEALRAGLHDRLDGIEIAVDDFCSVNSFSIDLPLAFRLAQRIDAHLADPGCDGVVVTHGTDTMEESAYLADLVVSSSKPVVFTGAQRSADAPDTDGPRNIAEAVRLAATPEAAGLGAMILFESHFHAARDVTKTIQHGPTRSAPASMARSARWTAPGPHHRRPLLRRTFAPTHIETGVELVRMAMGASDRVLRFWQGKGPGPSSWRVSAGATRPPS